LPLLSRRPTRRFRRRRHSVTVAAVGSPPSDHRRYRCRSWTAVQRAVRFPTIPNCSTSEEGGIAALLKLGKSKISIGNMQYKAALTVGQMAKNACSQLGSTS
jgi:hypothetical protein